MLYTIIKKKYYKFCIFSALYVLKNENIVIKPKREEDILIIIIKQLTRKTKYQK